MKRLLSIQQLKDTKGFTLIELMIVIAIIGILATAGVGAMFFTSRDRARDAATKQKIKALGTGMETYYSLNRRYTLNPNTNGCPIGSTQSIFPPDLTSGFAYTSDCYNTPSVSFCICAEMKVKDSGNSINDDCTYNGGGSKDYFCVSELQ